MISKKGMVSWQGSLREGRGTVSTESGTIDKVNYTFAKRFGDDAGTNPEELIGAAHAACFSMALSNMLAENGTAPDDLDITATVTLDASSLTITTSHLDVTAKVPGIDAEKFAEIAKAAKEGCPVSKLLNAEITMDAKLG